MGQQFSSEEEYSQVKDAIGSVLYNAMAEAGAVPDLGVVQPLLLANHNQCSDSPTCLQDKLQQLQSNIGNRVPAYLKDLIGRLTTFSDDPRLAGLVGLVVTLVMDMAYTSSRPSLGVKVKSESLSSCQERVWEIQEVMEEYLKRCRINLSNKNRLLEDSVRLEGELSLILTQLKTCMLRGDCDSRALRHWASGAVFHTQMLVHLSALEGLNEPLVAREALDQYKEDLTEIIPVYRQYKSNTVCVMKCRGGLPASYVPHEVPEEGSMTGLIVTDSETGKSVTLPLNTLETEIETGRRRRVSVADDTLMPSSINLDLITSDQYSQAYLDYLFSDRGHVAELENYFNKTKDNLQTLRTPGCVNKTGLRHGIQQSEDGQAQGMNIKERREERAKDRMEVKQRQEGTEELIPRDESLKLSITETKPEESLHHSASTT